MKIDLLYDVRDAPPQAGHFRSNIYIPIGSMVLLYMVTWIPSIYPSHVSIYTIHGSYGIVLIFVM